MTPDARLAAAIGVLDLVLKGAPAEQTLTNWARQSRYAGSGDRAAVRDLVFDAIRRRRSLAWMSGSETGRGLMRAFVEMQGDDPNDLFTGQGYGPPALSPDERVFHKLDAAPDAVRLDCQDWLWPHLSDSLGPQTEAVLSLMQSRAPVFLRHNRARTTRKDAIALLARDNIAARPHPLSPTAIEVTTNPRRVRNAKAFLDGHVEFQDAASQAVTDVLVGWCPSGHVLDYCAGGGGKALALAAHGCRVTAHDIDPHRMKDIPARSARAGVRIATTDAPQGLFDAVLCDAPCSGSGAWRRQPDAKWTLTPDRLAELNSVQDSILDQAKERVAPGGILAYATCSILQCENVARIESFLQRHPDWRLRGQKSFTPIDGGDGFFIAGLISAK